jgi:hypothetical protein
MTVWRNVLIEVELRAIDIGALKHSVKSRGDAITDATGARNTPPRLNPRG